MDEPAGTPPEPTDVEPSQPAPRRRLRRLGLWAAAAAACAAVTLGLLLRHEPAFYRGLAAGGGAAAEQRARRLVTRLSALHADFVRPGPWEAVLAGDEINAWLATDLPRNHPRLLPAGLTEPRVAIGPRRLRAAARVGPLLGGVASVEAEVVLRGVNQLGIAVTDARLGALPLPRGPVIRELARRIDALGMATELRRLDGRTLLVVYIPSTHDAGATSHWLEALALEDGGVVVAGVTRAAGQRR